MKVLWTELAWEDYLYWQQNDRDIIERINKLIEDARQAPVQGLGKPEPLKGEFAEWWSRRITREHRLVYRVAGKAVTQQLEIAQCRYHY